MSLFKSAFIVGAFTFISRIFGYVRDVFIAAFLGAGPIADAFFIAFRLPNFFRQLSAEGAFNAAFIPLFSGELASNGKNKAINFAEKVFSFMAIFTIIITIIVEISMPGIMVILAPGFLDNPEQFDLAVALSRISFIYFIFVSLVSLLGGMLNSLGKFAAAAAAPIILNLCMIGSLLYMSEYTITPAHALVWGIAGAGMVQLLWLLGAGYKVGIRLKLRLPRIDESIKTLLKRMGPGIVGGGVMQINIWINTVIATLIPGAVSYLYYADRFVQFPLAIIGTAVGVALLPALSKQRKENDIEKAIYTQNRALEIVLLFALPASVALIVISQPIISVMFERGAFTYRDSLATAAALSAYAIGLPAFVMVKIFAPSFFSVGDTKTPVKIALLCLTVNVILNLILIHPLGHVGLAISTSFSSWLNAMLLQRMLTKHDLYKSDMVLNKRIPKLILSTLLMGLILWWEHLLLIDYSLSDDLSHKVLSLVILILTGAISFFLLTQITKAYKVNDIKKLLSET